MKKIIAIVLAMMTVFSYATVAFAESTTTLTTTVPDAEYTLNIPEDQEIPFGATMTDIGTITVTDSSGFAEGKDLRISVIYSGNEPPVEEESMGYFTSEGIATKIPFHAGWQRYEGHGGDDLNSYVFFRGQADGSVEERYCPFDDAAPMDYIAIEVFEEDWNKALAGDYSATLTFTAEVVSAEDETE